MLSSWHGACSIYERNFYRGGAEARRKSKAKINHQDTKARKKTFNIVMNVLCLGVFVVKKVFSVFSGSQGLGG